jgi:hypothetical protein
VTTCSTEVPPSIALAETGARLVEVVHPTMQANTLKIDWITHEDPGPKVSLTCPLDQWNPKTVGAKIDSSLATLAVDMD